jgi:hypothetical protein
LEIPLDIVNDINKDLYKNYEISGIINCNDNNKVIGVDKNKGSADSVYTPNHVINYHTHPISAYKQGHTTWGWPSGEDIRETLKFALAGNKAHLVFTVEGLYTIQVSPCKLKKMKDLLNDQERGAIVFLIEYYFKSTHNFRGIEELKSLKTNITPEDYVKFVNTFNISNMECPRKIVHPRDTTGIPNVGFPEIDDDRIINLPMNHFITKTNKLFYQIKVLIYAQYNTANRQKIIESVAKCSQTAAQQWIGNIYCGRQIC